LKPQVSKALGSTRPGAVRLAGASLLAAAMLAGCQIPDVRDVRAQRGTADKRAYTHASVHLQVAAAQMEQGQLVEAQRSLSRARQWAPNHPEVHLLQSQLYLERDQADKALASLQEALKVDPHLAPAHYQAGLIQMRMKRHPDALKSFRRAIQIDASRPEHHMALSACLAACDRKDESLRVLVQASQRFGTNSEIFEVLGENYRMREQHRRALNCFKRAVAVDETNLQARKSLAYSYYWVREYEDAIPHFQTVLDHPSVDESAPLRASLGECLMHADRLPEAVKSLTRACQLDEANARAQVLLANVLTRQRQWVGARAAYVRALKLDPQRAEARYMRGYVAFRQGESDQAMRHYQAALRLAPKDPVVHLLLGQCYEQIGQPEQAREHFAKALELDPSYELARKRLARLQKAGTTIR